MNPPSCAPSASTLCDQFVPYGTQVFVPTGFTIDLLQSYADGYFRFANFIIYSEPCRSLYLQMLCLTWLRPCQNNSGTIITLPQQVCNPTCQNYLTGCLPIAAAANEQVGLGLYFPYPLQAPLYCNETELGVGEMYPAPPTAVYSYNSANLTLPCNAQPTVNYTVPRVCNEPLELVHDARGRQACGFTCPLPYLTDSQFTSVKVMQGIMGWFSWAFSAVMIFSNLLNPRFREFPKNLIIMTACAANVAAGAIILPTFAGYENTWCGGSGESVNIVPALGFTIAPPFYLPDFTFEITDDQLYIESSLCTFQGALLQYGFLAAVFWWGLIAFNMALELYFNKLLSLEKKVWQWTRFGIYNVIGWGLPFFLMVIPASAARIKFVPGASYCFISPEDNNAWSLTFWFLPVGIAMLTGVVLFIAALIRITIMIFTISKYKSLILLYLRLFVFIFLYLFLFTVIFAYNIHQARDSDHISQGFSDYFKCLIVATDCSLDESVSNYNLIMLRGWAISALGTLLFFTFLSIESFMFWYRLLKSIVFALLRKKGKGFQSVLHVLTHDTGTMITLTSKDSVSMSEVGGPVDDEEEEESKDRESGKDETDEVASFEPDGTSSSE